MRCGYSSIVQATEESVPGVSPCQQGGCIPICSVTFPLHVQAPWEFLALEKEEEVQRCGQRLASACHLQQRAILPADIITVSTWAPLVMSTQPGQAWPAPPRATGAENSTRSSAESFQLCRWVPAQEAREGASWQRARAHTLWAEMTPVCILGSASDNQHVVVHTHSRCSADAWSVPGHTVFSPPGNWARLSPVGNWPCARDHPGSVLDFSIFPQMDQGFWLCKNSTSSCHQLFHTHQLTSWAKIHEVS